MLVGYFDESGNHDSSRTFCIGGYVADSRDWLEFTRAWRSALREAGVSCFHMADFENRRGEFQGWDNSKRISFLKELIAIIASIDVWGIGTGVVRDDFNRVSAEMVPKSRLTPAWWHHPYLLAFQACVVEAANQVDHLPPSERVAFVFDQQAEFCGRAQLVHNGLQADEAWPRRHRVGSLEFKSKTDAIPLQAADFMAYELNKVLDHKLYDSTRQERRSMARLKRRLISPRYYDENALRALFASLL